ncbi:MAG: hypothetical protein JNJ98_20455 [Gemmatimonadetes bacterium]|nr:hypothetical protein [Gemmatimonadota bacterium]
MPEPRSLLRIDSTAGLVVGVLVLLLSPWLSRLFALPLGFLVFTGAANLAYGSFSGSLARRSVRPRRLITVLVVANAAWAVLCLVSALTFARSASGFGLLHLVGEALFVGGLAMLEWRHRELLLVAPAAAT